MTFAVSALASLNVFLVSDSALLIGPQLCPKDALSCQLLNIVGLALYTSSIMSS